MGNALNGIWNARNGIYDDDQISISDLTEEQAHDFEMEKYEDYDEVRNQQWERSLELINNSPQPLLNVENPCQILNEYMTFNRVQSDEFYGIRQKPGSLEKRAYYKFSNRSKDEIETHPYLQVNKCYNALLVEIALKTRFDNLGNLDCFFIDMDKPVGFTLEQIEYINNPINRNLTKKCLCKISQQFLNRRGSNIREKFVPPILPQIFCDWIYDILEI